MGSPCFLRLGTSRLVRFVLQRAGATTRRVQRPETSVPIQAPHHTLLDCSDYLVMLAVMVMVAAASAMAQDDKLAAKNNDKTKEVPKTAASPSTPRCSAPASCSSAVGCWPAGLSGKQELKKPGWRK